MDNVGISPSRKWKETENNRTPMNHEFYFQILYRNIFDKVVQLSIYFITMENDMDDNIL